MKSILIPTDYHEDTLHAMELTWRNVTAEPVRIILLSLSELPTSTSEILFLSNDDSDRAKEKRLHDEWEMRTSLLNIRMDVIEHHQYGASVPIIGQIMDQFNVRSVIIPYSIQKTEKDVYMEAMRSLQRTKCKITWMPERIPYFITA